jgi:hypothetical protein
MFHSHLLFHGLIEPYWRFCVELLLVLSKNGGSFFSAVDALLICYQVRVVLELFL